MTANLIFPHQLFENHPLANQDGRFYLIEEYLFFRQYPFHKQKLAFHRASMKIYVEKLEKEGKSVKYIDSQDKRSDIRNCLESLKSEGYDTVNVVDPTDNWLEQRIKTASEKTKLKLDWFDSPMFLNTRKDNQDFFKPSKKKFFQTSFYRIQRESTGILMEENGNPTGGKLTYDSENRKKYPSKKQPPPVYFPGKNNRTDEAVAYVEKHFPKNPGSLNQFPIYPVDTKSAKEGLQHFLEYRLHEFGPYEDAIVKEEHFLHHSVLTPALNSGLLTPKEVLQSAIEFAEEHEVPINSLEGFVRQIMGWREFIRGVYEAKGGQERTTNYWGFDRKIPKSFYNGSTGIPPIDQTIQKVLETGYCHHIERLMILGNFMVLCEFDPDEVYSWFMELFIDAYDWVMVPNVYGMCLYADGGLMSTKPYISGSNYLLKMSNYSRGPWTEIWDGLFWRFMQNHRSFFEQNPRLNMLVRNLDRMDEHRKEVLLEKADQFLKSLSNGKSLWRPEPIPPRS